MSGYWDAIGRAALGQAGTAVPRPRSIFESDATDPSLAGFDEGESETDAEPSPVAPVSNPVVPASTVTALQGSDRQVQPVVAVPLEDSTDDDQQAADNSSAQPHLAEPQIPALPRASEPKPEDPKTLRIVERLEIHRLETSPLVTEVRLASAEADRGPEASSQPVVVPANPEGREGSALAEPEQRNESIEPRVTVAAEPIDVVADLPAPAQELPPLVIEIDRIDIRIESQTAAIPAASRRRETATVPSLHEYLEQQGGASR